jgi:Hint domain
MVETEHKPFDFALGESEFPDNRRDQFADHEHHHDDHHHHHHDDCVCFMGGTRILTPSGEVNVEDLRRGDLVLTLDGSAAPVRWIGRQAVTNTFAVEATLPVRIKAGALDVNVPSRDLLVSDRHALLVDGILIQAGALMNGATVSRERDAPNHFVYYHVELDNHSLILADNTPAETFIDNVDRERFDNWHEYQALYPTGKSIEEMPLPRAKSARQVPGVVRARLATRTLELLGSAADAA